MKQTILKMGRLIVVAIALIIVGVSCQEDTPAQMSLLGGSEVKVHLCSSNSSITIPIPGHPACDDLIIPIPKPDAVVELQFFEKRKQAYWIEGFYCQKWKLTKKDELVIVGANNEKNTKEQMTVEPEECINAPISYVPPPINLEKHTWASSEASVEWIEKHTFTASLQANKKFILKDLGVELDLATGRASPGNKIYYAQWAVPNKMTQMQLIATSECGLTNKATSVIIHCPQLFSHSFIQKSTPQSDLFEIEGGSFYLTNTGMYVSAHEILRGYITTTRSVRPESSNSTNLRDSLIESQIENAGVVTDTLNSQIIGLNEFTSCQVRRLLIRILREGDFIAPSEMKILLNRDTRDVAGVVKSDAIALHYCPIVTVNQVGMDKRNKVLVKLNNEDYYYDESTFCMSKSKKVAPIHDHSINFLDGWVLDLVSGKLQKHQEHHIFEVAKFQNVLKDVELVHDVINPADYRNSASIKTSLQTVISREIGFQTTKWRMILSFMWYPSLIILSLIAIWLSWKIILFTPFGLIKRVFTWRKKTEPKQQQYYERVSQDPHRTYPNLASM